MDSMWHTSCSGTQRSRKMDTLSRCVLVHSSYSMRKLTAFFQDLSYLNRDLSKVVLLDTDPDHCTTHPENSIVIPKWKGAPGDRGLVAMIPFLECRSSV